MTSQEYRDALVVLENDPTNPAANLAAGRHLCLVQGDWDRGLPMLALGSDAELKAAATKDLAGAARPRNKPRSATLGGPRRRRNWDRTATPCGFAPASGIARLNRVWSEVRPG